MTACASKCTLLAAFRSRECCVLLHVDYANTTHTSLCIHMATTAAGVQGVAPYTHGRLCWRHTNTPAERKVWVCGAWDPLAGVLWWLEVGACVAWAGVVGACAAFVPGHGGTRSQRLEKGG